MLKNSRLALYFLVFPLLGGAALADDQFGSRDEARALLDKAVAAVKVDKTKALAMFNKGEGGFRVKDLQPFCFDAKTGELLASTVPANVGKIQCNFKDATGKEFGKEMCSMIKEGEIGEISYQYPRPGAGSAPVPKTSFVTLVDGLGCGVGYYQPQQ